MNGCLPDIGSRDKLYLVARNDMTVGQQAVQLCHAMRLFVQEHPDVDGEWYRTSNHLALLNVNDEPELLRLFELLKNRGLRCSLFRESDMDDRPTALAAEPFARRMCRKLPIAFKELP